MVVVGIQYVDTGDDLPSELKMKEVGKKKFKKLKN